MKVSLAILCGMLAAMPLWARAETLSQAAQGLVEAERAFAQLAKEGLLSRMHGHFVLTRQGRLLADLVVRRLTA